MTSDDPCGAMTACDRCLRRTWLLERIGSHLDFRAGVLIEVLDLEDDALIASMGGAMRREVQVEHAHFRARDAAAMRERAGAAGLAQVCRCDGAYPDRLTAVRAAPAVLHVAGGVERFGELCGGKGVALVGARDATEYGLEVAEALGRGVSASGMVVVSGMARGVDGRAHEGALQAGGGTLAVLPGCAATPYPRAKRALHARILASGAAISETGPGARVRRWMFPARNRLIAALSSLVVVVQATARSGSLLTVAAARAYGRPVGAVPGSVLSRLSEAPNALLRDGALLVRGPQDVLDAVFGAGVRLTRPRSRAGLDGAQTLLLDAIASGADTLGAMHRVGAETAEILATLAALELHGHVRRLAGGRYVADA